ncbi:MAG: chemotaxis protein CheW [Bdellovibrionaceae bacterium]|nr:chemotaxis protein CheW [Pseudobdellovibrionaceae bacterium]
MQFNDQEFAEFKQECLELLDQAEEGLLAIGKGENFSAHYDAIFRAFHSVKGAAGMVGIEDLQSHMHDLESYFSNMKGQESLDQNTIDFLLKGCDKARKILGVEVSGASEDRETILATPTSDSSQVSIVSDASFKEFMAEATELLQRMNETLAKIEKEGMNQELISSLYRDMHTIKGSSGLFGFTNIGDFAHVIESHLELMRSGQSKLTPDMIDLLYKSFDLLEVILDGLIKETPHQRNDEIEEVKKQLLAAEDPASNNTNAQVIVATAPSTPAPSTTETAPVVKQNVSPIKASQAPQNSEEVKQDGAQTLRVSVDLLDRLMTLVGEMVLVRNQVIQYSNKNEDLQFINLSKRLDVVTSEIQAEVMKTRMQPIGSILNKFHRVVRDVARDLNKKIEIHFFGSETELDKALLESVKDPLMHIVRNSCDHGIENPTERIQSGKSEVGNITIRAFHEGGQVVIEIADDGKGLDREKIINKAIEKNIIAPDKVNHLSEKDIYNFIFAPGFSTAQSVTNISGRGVGMDVVRKNIEKIGGMVDIDSVQHKGTTMRLKIPLTLAIVPAIIIRSGVNHFAIPQVKLVELVRIEKDKSNGQIELLQGQPVYRLRGKLLPIINLRKVLGLSEDGAIEQSPVVNIVVVDGDSVTFGLVVDEVQDTADIVVKPLNQMLKSLSIYSGATVLGDGSISLILDITGIASTQNMYVSGGEDNSVLSKAAVSGKNNSEVNEFLLVNIGTTAVHAIPLSMVQRMEEFSGVAIERSGDIDIVQYRDSILPLVNLHQALGYPTGKKLSEMQKIPVVVTKVGHRMVGLCVEEILDVINSDQAISDACVDRPGILGNFTHDNKVIVVVDVLNSLRQVPFLKQDLKFKTISSSQKHKILFAEDTEFFRRHVSQLLTKSGYEVVTAENGKQAFSFLEAAPTDFQLVLSDIEMPEMNGLELAKKVRSVEKFKSLPMIALTTRYNTADIAGGREAGFDAYLEKLNPEILLKEITDVLTKKISKGVA